MAYRELGEQAIFSHSHNSDLVVYHRGNPLTEKRIGLGSFSQVKLHLIRIAFVEKIFDYHLSKHTPTSHQSIVSYCHWCKRLRAIVYLQFANSFHKNGVGYLVKI